MKYLYTFTLLLMFCAGLAAQSCPATATHDLHANNIRARILNGGDLFTDGSDGYFLVNPEPGVQTPSNIFSAALWFAGIDPAANLQLNAITYRGAGGGPYAPGPVDNQTGQAADCEDWDLVFHVADDEILAALNDLDNPDAPSLYPNVYGWPARGNPYFNSIWGFYLPDNTLAAFFDSNADGVYDPKAGDFPAVGLRGLPLFVPAEITWAAYNSINGNPGTSGVPMEIHQTCWAFDCEDLPPLQNAVFTSHKYIYRGTEPLDSFHVSLWTDFDCGNFADEYSGCDPARNTVYSYAGGMPSCNPRPGFGAQTPVHSMTLLDSPLDFFMYYRSALVGAQPPGVTTPGVPVEFFRYMTGTWRDGTPLTVGGNGYNPFDPLAIPTPYAFPEPPNLPNGWSMCSANISYGENRVVATTKIGRLDPGAVNELTAAWMANAVSDLPCSYGTTKDNVDAVRALYDNEFKDVCALVTSSRKVQDMAIRVFPNPATDRIRFDLGAGIPRSIQIFSADGRLVLEHNTQTEINCADWPTGIYTATVTTQNGKFATRIAVIR